MDAGSLARRSKRKAVDAPEGNERLSKRLSLLNLESSGTRLYIPVESVHVPAAPASAPAPAVLSSTSAQAVPSAAFPIPARLSEEQKSGGSDGMQVDDTKYKVYIYDIDEELAGDEDEDQAAANAVTTHQGNGSDGDGNVVLLPDLDKHLRMAARDAALLAPTQKLAIPLPVRANEDGELAGMQLVLYNDPSSLSVPREQDSVRQAILDARARIRARQREEQEDEEQQHTQTQDIGDAAILDDDDDDEGAMADEESNAGTPIESTHLAGTPMCTTPLPDDDAMELD